MLSLFHPHTLILSSTQPLTLMLDAKTLSLAPNHPATIHSTTDGLSLEFLNNPELIGGTLELPSAHFTLTVPGKLTRGYTGALSISISHNTLMPVVTMPTELAVASIVQAESPPHASFEALKAQAIVSRSFLLAQPSPHSGFDTCDTTHCQFLRSPPTARSPATLATQATRGLVLTWRPSPDQSPRIVRAMYARSCGGHTRPRPSAPGEYPFYRVACAFCLRHPETWHRPAGIDASANEQQRLRFNRTHGWSAIPSNTHHAPSAGTEGIEGRGIGHGVGLCQLGANDMAAHGASYEKVVTHFFPNTTLTQVE